MKRQKKSEINIQDGDTDRLTSLPDHLLLHIIEFMNIKHSVQTCVLSKRWKDLWKSITNLMLRHEMYLNRSDIFNKFVFRILYGRDNSLPLHSLEYDVVDPSKTAVLDVMKYAASHNVQQLIVHVNSLFKEEDFEFPPSIFYCHSLTFLKLDFTHMFPFFLNRSKNMFPKSLNLPALKTLHLISITFTTSNNGCAEPFSTCNMLNTLLIMSCYLEDDAQTLCISNSNITSLTVGGTKKYEEAHNYKVVFCTPKLTSLTITGRPTYLAPSACNLPFIEEVNVDYTFLYIPYEGLVMSSWLQLLANVKIMTLSFHTLEQILSVLKNNGLVKNQPPCFVRLKSLKVELRCDSKISSEEVRGMVNYLLQNSPQIKVDIIKQPCGSGTFRECCYAKFEAAD
ncbi:F-box/LRR-repeat protein At4g14103-like [Trifolium pratense]|uniref:F-box/LRR-repeat protein At4g14103-like n=1 Tax=Trifolium pratense TaxID=57577 RepID=UPI001E697B57|nr:F-box/LRR-repeat protein At4g14103-like [Trifolium pratense]